MRKLLWLLPLVALAFWIERPRTFSTSPPVRRSIVDHLRLSCEKQGFVDVFDFGAKCDGSPADRVLIGYAEENAKTCIPGRVLPVRYCPVSK